MGDLEKQFGIAEDTPLSELPMEELIKAYEKQLAEETVKVLGVAALNGSQEEVATDAPDISNIQQPEHKSIIIGQAVDPDALPAFVQEDDSAINVSSKTSTKTKTSVRTRDMRPEYTPRAGVKKRKEIETDSDATAIEHENENGSSGAEEQETPEEPLSKAERDALEAEENMKARNRAVEALEAEEKAQQTYEFTDEEPEPPSWTITAAVEAILMGKLDEEELPDVITPKQKKEFKKALSNMTDIKNKDKPEGFDKRFRSLRTHYRPEIAKVIDAETGKPIIPPIKSHLQEHHFNKERNTKKAKKSKLK